MQYKSWRPQKPHVKYRATMKNHDDYPTTQIFDNVIWIGNTYAATLLFDTHDGYVLMDNMTYGDAEFIENEMIKAGADPARLKYILITHAHMDHFGNAGYFQKKYGTKILMSEIDAAWGHNPASLPPNAPLSELMQFDADGFLKDGERLVVGDMWFEAYITPGHTPGCVSYVFPVWDEGRMHLATMWGGTGPSNTLEANRDLLESAIRFTDLTMNMGVDVEISNHPFVDNSITRLETINKIVDGVPNPFIIGSEGYYRYQKMFIDMYRDVVKKFEQEA